MADNRTILEKADLKVADMISDGGYLQPEQSQEFFRTAISQSTILPQAFVHRMTTPSKKLPKIRFATRVLRRAVEGQALNINERSKPELSQVELTPKLFKAEADLTNEDLEDSIERGNLTQTIFAILGERVALDMDEVASNGDTTDADPFLASFDGVIKLAASNPVAAGGNPMSKSLFKAMYKAMPNEFLRMRPSMRFLLSIDSDIDYRDTLSSRETALGDRFLETDSMPQYGGVPIMPIPVFPENLGVGNNETVAILTDPKNIHVGILRDVKIETQKDVSAGVLKIVLSVRFDVKILESRATVKATGIRVAA